jgi:UTP:GlnB (protein PII) uridylyltransferase
VYATDRLGLLYRLATTFQQLGLTVHLARVSNYALQARDVFYVTDIDGRKILDEGRLESLRSAVLVAAEGGAVDQRQGPGGERRAS